MRDLVADILYCVVLVSVYTTWEDALVLVSQFEIY